MSIPGRSENPLRVAIVGSGPAGFYTLQHLFQATDLSLTVDVFDSLPTPFGLVRYGVAPDHQKIKSVTAVYDRLARDPRFRFFGNVKFGRDVTLADLRAHYHQLVFCTGAQTDRRLAIPGEELDGSYPATEFVAWYNGHPDYSHLRFDLTRERAVVVGVGNVAVDVARILCRSPEELASTDIADHALAALRESRVRVVYLLGRRGPAQAAFTNPEVKELGELEQAETSTLPGEIELDPLSREDVEAGGDRSLERKLGILRGMADRRQPERPRKLILRFLVSPVELVGDASGRVSAVRLVRNELYRAGSGALKSRATDREETLDAGLVFRSVGYHGIPLPGLPFREDRGIVPNEGGRIVESDGSAVLPALYVAGWIKRGPSGVIGTNKADAGKTVARMLEDLGRGISLRPPRPAPEELPRLLEQRGVRFVSYDDWLRIDDHEVRSGRATGRPRVKLTTREQFARSLAD